ncbi:MAG TPA: transglutaminase-like domain-containing protein [Gemmatimonadales bacterium]|jgi:hypothetical protein
MLQLYRPSIRAAGAIFVLTAWVGSLAWLGVRRLGQSEDTTLSNEATLRLAPGTVWYALKAGDTQVGTAAVTLDTLSPGYRVDAAVMLASPSAEGLVRVNRRTEVWLGSTLNIEKIHSRLSRDGREDDWDITVHGDTLQARHTAARNASRGMAMLATAPTAAWVMPYRLALGGGLVPGHERSLTLLEGWPIAAGVSRLRVGTDTMVRFADSSRYDPATTTWTAVHTDSARSYPVTLAGPGGPRRVWVDRHGTVTRISTPFGVEWLRTDFDLSETAFRKELPARTAAIRAALPRLLAYAAAPGTDTATNVRRFLVQHRDGSPVDTALLALFAGGRQSVHGDTITVKAMGPMTAGESSADTLPDPTIQTEPLPVMALERRLVQEPVTAATLPTLVAAFHALVQLDTAATAADDALGATHAPARPDGIARLFVAVLRASNVSARYVTGIYPQGDTLWTHAWVEVWIPAANGWAAVDPVSGRAVTNTGLIRLAFAGSSHPEEMLAQVANARFVDITPKVVP